MEVEDEVICGSGLPAQVMWMLVCVSLYTTRARIALSLSWFNLAKGNCPGCMLCNRGINLAKGNLAGILAIFFHGTEIVPASQEMDFLADGMMRGSWTVKTVDGS